MSHDRWFVGRLANRIVEITEDGITDYRGTYKEYVHACGDDHLDADTVVLKAREERRKGRGGGGAGGGGRGRARLSHVQRRRLEERAGELAGRIEAAEARVAEIEAVFADAAFYSGASPGEVRKLEEERAGLVEEVAARMAEWEGVEGELGVG